MNTKQILSQIVTVHDLAETHNVSKVRAHSLIKTYGIATRRIGQMLITTKTEARKIPKKRPPGRKPKR